ncbi:HAD-IA family hydrolase [Streptomyces sp. NPDC050264]|uniref:HAD family hydrolase n=1 Tax=Streptomyces sp. NPDC050264 TaxID=3155038 RepID=UPI0034421406
MFDLDGTLTKTETQHRRAWQEAINTSLGDPHLFTAADYHELDGIAPLPALSAFFDHHGVRVPEGSADDPPGHATVRGIVARKRKLYRSMLAAEGAEAYPGSLRFLAHLRDRGIPLAVVSASSSCREVLRETGLSDSFPVVVDGPDIKRQHLAGKPSPDSFLAAARQLDVPAPRCAVFEDAPSGIRAARSGGFHTVVAVHRSGSAHHLTRENPDILVCDLTELL